MLKGEEEDEEERLAGIFIKYESPGISPQKTLNSVLNYSWPYVLNCFPQHLPVYTDN